MILNIRNLLLAIYLFIMIFQPPFCPLPSVYIFGIAVGLYLIIRSNGKISLTILKKSGMWKLCQLYIILFVYLLFISIVNISSGGEILIVNRLKMVNQLLVLPAIQMLGIYVFFLKTDKYKLSIDDMINLLFIAGTMQGISTAFAYLSPEVRSVFLNFYDEKLVTNTWIMARRLFGFSSILVDFYGYGMGLIAGLALLDTKKSIIPKTLIMTFCFLSIIFNARTGIIIFAVAVVLSFIRYTNTLIFVLKLFATLMIFFLCYRYFIPAFLDFLLKSENMTLLWVGDGLKEILSLLYSGATINDLNVLSTFILPDNLLDLIFGVGHNLYDSGAKLGVHSDVGYINSVWEFGIFGSIVYYVGIIRWFLYVYNSAGNKKIMVIFLLIAYFAVSFKGVVLGYSPGSAVTYLVCFSIMYTSECTKKVMC